METSYSKQSRYDLGSGLVEIPGPGAISPSMEYNFIPSSSDSFSNYQPRMLEQPITARLLNQQPITARLLNVTALCSRASISITAEFSSPFKGVVYSNGYYDNPSCHYPIKTEDGGNKIK